ncbi:MAG: enoyl-CoA hydratase/isomerase family protein [Tepidisphaera sp.]
MTIHADQAPSLAPLPLSREASGPFAGVVTVTLEQPGKPVVVLDETLIRRLELTLKQVPRDSRGLVLASASERVFVAGADLKTIQDASDADLHRYLAYAASVFALLPALPFPTVAAINGAVLGGGLELAMHCDGLVAAPGLKPYPVGLPEAGLNICPGWGGTNLLPARIDPAQAILMTAEGKPFLFDNAKAAGMFDAVAPSAADLLDTARRWVVDRAAKGRLERDGTPLRWIGRPSVAAKVLEALESVRETLPQTEAAAAVALAIDDGLAKGWNAALATEQRELVRLRGTPAGKASIAAFFAKK